jgi:hypothetical protein
VLHTARSITFFVDRFADFLGEIDKLRRTRIECSRSLNVAADLASGIPVGTEHIVRGKIFYRIVNTFESRNNVRPRYKRAM